MSKKSAYYTYTSIADLVEGDESVHVAKEGVDVPSAAPLQFSAPHSHVLVAELQRKCHSRVDEPKKVGK